MVGSVGCCRYIRIWRILREAGGGSTGDSGILEVQHWENHVEWNGFFLCTCCSFPAGPASRLSATVVLVQSCLYQNMKNFVLNSSASPFIRVSMLIQPFGPSIRSPYFDAHVLGWHVASCLLGFCQHRSGAPLPPLLQRAQSTCYTPRLQHTLVDTL